jgi:hypothetical protein
MGQCMLLKDIYRYVVNVIRVKTFLPKYCRKMAVSTPNVSFRALK